LGFANHSGLNGSSAVQGLSGAFTGIGIDTSPTHSRQQFVCGWDRRCSHV
jgi:hypothetical protein